MARMRVQEDEIAALKRQLREANELRDDETSAGHRESEKTPGVAAAEQGARQRARAKTTAAPKAPAPKAPAADKTPPADSNAGQAPAGDKTAL